MGHLIKGTIAVFILIIWTQQTCGIIGYDCGSASTNLTTLSLINVEECDVPLPNVNSSKVYIQLLQLNEFKSVQVIQCKLEIDRSIKKCGMFSHTMDVYNGKYSYIEEVSREACQRMHTYGSFELAGTQVTGLKSNRTTTRPVILAGYVDSDGACSGGAYSDPYGTWADVIVLGSIKITLMDYIVDVRLNTNRVQLRSGVACELSATHCTDMEGGDTFWDPVPADSCQFSYYSVLYQGYADKIIDSVNELSQAAYSLTAEGTVFALTTTGKYATCGYTLIRTEHPKLIIFEAFPGMNIFRNAGRVTNLDIFTYMNSKFVYVEKHIRTQINQLYRNILLQQCNLELRLMQNALAIAASSPDIFAYHFMRGPGYMALLAGEVIHIIKCVPVEVRLAQTQECYDQLPVMWENQTYFLTPQTHILLRQGTQITCNTFAPPMYHLGDAWYKLMPRPVETIAPTVMKPSTKPTWRYVNPGALATSGIYSQDDLENLKDHIMFPAERPALLNTVARGIMGRSTSLHGGSISNLIDEASIEKIVVSTWQKFWNRFLIFGNISAGLLGIYLCIRGVKLILDTLVHGYALHTVYGWSMYLLGAVWDSLTQLLLHLGKRKPETKEPSAPGSDNLKHHETPFPDPQSHTGNNTELKHTDPSLPSRETVTYTFELKD